MIQPFRVYVSDWFDFGDDMKMSNYIDCERQPRLKKEYFLGIDKALSYANIENVIDEQNLWDNNKNVVKFVALYLAFVGLLGVDNRKLI